MYISGNKPQSEMTASPEKYPQGFFKSKDCRECGTKFEPQAPSHLYCCQECASKAFSTAYLKRNYGISVADYQELHQKQGGLCAICFGEGFTMATHHKMKLVVDHCHATGKIRGLLCHNCNRALGLLKDSTEVLQTAIKYLEGAETIRKEYASSEVEAPSPQQ